MNNPPKDQVQRFMAELMGWTKLENFTRQHFTGDFDVWLIGHPPGREDRCRVPNWPGSFDAARKLEIGVKYFFQLCLYDIMTDSKYNPDFATGVAAGFTQASTIWYTPYQFCLAYIMSEHGYKWDSKKEKFIHV